MKKEMLLLLFTTLLSVVLLFTISSCALKKEANENIKETEIEITVEKETIQQDIVIETETIVEETTTLVPEDTTKITIIETTCQQPEVITPEINEQWIYAPKSIQSSAKTYEPYYAITDQTSKQWPLLNGILIHGEDGMIRDSDGYIAAALGSYFGPIGSRWIFLLDNGKQLKIIKADQKQDIHTANGNGINGIGSYDIIEFIVNPNIMPKWSNGYVYGGNFNNIEEYQGTVVAWQRID